ncbi:uncharacterized protein PG998_002597 [Apiospora kogelbergensis]|uniref:uncharacterized protein n=1 Tax=Apiospora kogelbergensis TaxID=1337665 RepID=UPI00312F0E24
MNAPSKSPIGLSVAYQQIEDGQPPRRRRRFYQGWNLEIFAAFVSFGCIAAIVSVLYRMQGQPLERWTFPTNLNSTIAAFVTVAKSTSMLIVASCLSQRKWLHFKEKPSPLHDLDVFDEASRGPLGSLKLIWRLRSPINLAIFGALITILALTVDAFAQQIVKIEIQEQLSPENPGSFWMTNIYNGGAVVQNEASFPTQVERMFDLISFTLNSLLSNSSKTASTVDVAMERAIFRGIFDTTSTMAFTCSTNCTWENRDFISLGVQSDCVNVTSDTLDTKQYIEDPVETGSYPNVSSWFGSSVVMTTPSNLKVHYNYSDERYTLVEVVGKPLYYHSYKLPGGMEPLQTNIEGPYSPRFALIGILRTINMAPISLRPVNAEDEPKYAPTYQQLGTNVTEIFECSLKFVAHRYSGIKSVGRDLIVGKTDIIPLNTGEYHGPDVFLQHETYFATFNTSGNESFHISLPDLGALDLLFTGPHFSGGTFNGYRAPPASGLGILLKDANITATFEQVARSMTHQLHSEFNTGSQKQEGKRREQFIIVRVVWIWLSAPVLVHVVAVLFLLRTILHSSKSGTELWKSSAVALLYHEIVTGHRADREQTFHTPVQDVKQLAELATRVTLYKK